MNHHVWVEDRNGTALPFSKGVLAASVRVIGIEPEPAHHIAELVEHRLRNEGRLRIDVHTLMEVAAATIGGQTGSAAAERWMRWVAARRSQHPIIVLIGGATGAGKSTVATQVAARLGITGVVATDAIREVMRSVFPQSVMPSLHGSTFESHHALRVPVPADHDPVVVGFREQTEVVAAGITRLIDRAVLERTDLILEGVHLVPGMLHDAPWSGEAVVTHLVVAVTDAEQHRAHFRARRERAAGRRPDRYLDHFSEIRRIQRYIMSQAAEWGTPVVEVGQLDDAVQAVIDLVVEAVVSRGADSAQDEARSPA